MNPWDRGCPGRVGPRHDRQCRTLEKYIAFFVYIFLFFFLFNIIIYIHIFISNFSTLRHHSPPLDRTLSHREPRRLSTLAPCDYTAEPPDSHLTSCHLLLTCTFIPLFLFCPGSSVMPDAAPRDVGSPRPGPKKNRETRAGASVAGMSAEVPSAPPGQESVWRSSRDCSSPLRNSVQSCGSSGQLA